MKGIPIVIFRGMPFILKCSKKLNRLNAIQIPVYIKMVRLKQINQ